MVLWRVICLRGLLGVGEITNGRHASLLFLSKAAAIASLVELLCCYWRKQHLTTFVGSTRPQKRGRLGEEGPRSAQFIVILFTPPDMHDMPDKEVILVHQQGSFVGCKRLRAVRLSLQTNSTLSKRASRLICLQSVVDHPAASKRPKGNRATSNRMLPLQSHISSLHMTSKPMICQ